MIIVDDNMKFKFDNLKSQFRFAVGAIVMAACLFIASLIWDSLSSLLSIIAFVLFLLGVLFLRYHWVCPICSSLLRINSYFSNNCENCFTSFSKRI